MVRLPGTELQLKAEQIPQEEVFEALVPVFAISGGGLSLSQLCELSGLQGTTVQNWVKRGWVEPPQNKKYGPRQVARVLLINLLRPTMQLEQIAQLLTCINGRLDDRSDDMLSDEQLYSLVARLVLRLEHTEGMDAQAISRLVKETLREQDDLPAPAREKLASALEATLLNICAAHMMQRARELYTHIGILPPVAARNTHTA